MATEAERKSGISAPLGRRVTAYVIDIMAANMVLAEVVRFLNNQGIEQEFVFYFVIVAFSTPAYFIIWETRAGTTPGKLLLGLKVISVVGDGGEPSVGQVVRRRAPLVLGLVGTFFIYDWSYVVVTVALFLTVFIPDDRRGLHDRMASTMVVRRPRRSEARSPSGPTS